MIAKIIAVIINEIYTEFKKLQEPDHPDESVLSFSSALNPAQTGDGLEAQDKMSANIGFNWAMEDKNEVHGQRV